MPKNTALLIIDMQNDFVQKGRALEVQGIRKGLPKLKTFIDACRAKGIFVVYTRHCYTPKGNPIQAALFPFMTRKKALLKGTQGWQIALELQPEHDDRIIDKTRYDAFFRTRLHDILQRRKIGTVIITGTMTEVCCESTARTAMMLDYKVLFCADLTFTAKKEIQKRTLEVIEAHFGTVMKAKEIVRSI